MGRIDFGRINENGLDFAQNLSKEDTCVITVVVFSRENRSFLSWENRSIQFGTIIIFFFINLYFIQQGHIKLQKCEGKDIYITTYFHSLKYCSTENFINQSIKEKWKYHNFPKILISTTNFNKNDFWRITWHWSRGVKSTQFYSSERKDTKRIKRKERKENVTQFKVQVSGLKHIWVKVKVQL